MKSIFLTLVVVFSILIAISSIKFENTDDLPSQRPIIGIITQTHTTNTSYIAASYVKFIEMSGAQVIPIFMFNDMAYIDSILPKINGVLFPGKNKV